MRSLRSLALAAAIGILSYAAAQLVDPPAVRAHYCCHTFGDCPSGDSCTGDGCHGITAGWCEEAP